MKPTSRTLALRLIAASALAAGILSAQQEEDASRSLEPATPLAAAGIDASDGRVLGLGPDYKVEFGDGEITFVPALGQRAPRNFPLNYRLEAIGRGNDLAPVPDAELRHDEHSVEFVRDGVVERYDVRPDGIEQSFLLDRRPDGTGDLVVRGRLQTELEATATNDGVRFEWPEVGGVQIGTVRAFDADGRSVRGEIRVSGDTLDLRIPAAFIDRASFPLLVDPLIGTLRRIGGSAAEGQPDVSHVRSPTTQLIVWHVRLSSLDTDIFAMKTDGNGNIVGSPFAIESGTGLALAPRVASVAARSAFVVVWMSVTSRSLLGRVVPAGSGSLSPTVTVASGTTAAPIGPFDLGGEATTADDEAILVWQRSGSIFARQLNVSSTLRLTPFSTIVPLGSSSGRDSLPRISTSGGSTGRLCIVWLRGVSPLGRKAVRAALVTRNLTVLHDPILLTDGAVQHGTPCVDGDGSRWMVAYTKHPGGPTTSDGDVMARRIDYDASRSRGVLAAPERAIENDRFDDEIAGDVAWLGNSVLVSFADAAPSGYVVCVKSVDAYDCAPCEGEFCIQATRDVQTCCGVTTARASMVSEQSASSGASSRQNAYIVFSGQPSGGTADIFTRPFSAIDGATRSDSGGCGRSGTVEASCGIVGNASFDVRLIGAEPSRPAALLIGSSTETVFECGGCTLRIDPFRGYATPTTTLSSAGHGSFQLAIPNDTAIRGVTLHGQWLVGASSPRCNAFGFDLSDSFSLIIE